MLAVVCNGVRRLHRELVGQLNEVEDNCESTNVCGKGQLNSEWIYEVNVFPKTPTKNCRDFYPGSLLLQG